MHSLFRELIQYDGFFTTREQVSGTSAIHEQLILNSYLSSISSYMVAHTCICVVLKNKLVTLLG